MKEAAYYCNNQQGLTCQLCPHQCKILPGETGNCRVRRNVNNTLMSENYGRVSSLHLDPIEKKPLYHFFPGSQILSAGSVGCNLSCRFCQNNQISQCGIDDLPLISKMDPMGLLQEAKDIPGNTGLAFTYNEPFIWFEFVRDTARLSHEHGLKNVMVTNGFMQEQPLHDLLQCIDAFNVDLKAFTETFYRTITFSSLQPVLEALKIIHDAGKHLEITHLVIPGLNDNMEDFRSMLEWITQNLGRTVPLHLSRYYPMHRLNRPPTPIATLKAMYQLASSYLEYVYLGNVSYEPTGRDTHCPNCKALVIQREGYHAHLVGLDERGQCMYCHHPIVMR